MSGPRGFEIHIGAKCGVQTNEMRFGPSAPKAIRQMLVSRGTGWDDQDDDEDWGDDDDDEPWLGDEDNSEGEELDDEMLLALETAAMEEFATATTTTSFPSLPAQPPDEPMFPRIARSRMNLTAFSQRYDLYFVAYQDKIHVYRPQNAPEILRQPELVLQPRPSPEAKLLRGYVDPSFGHQVNHLITGNLGKHEILLFSYDDGDVTAYYTHRIASYVERYSPIWHANLSPPPRPLKPFFHETVGMSAWGLAIHQKSRLIAVSSNLHEVTVFAFALQDARRDCTYVELYEREEDPSPQTWAGVSALNLELLLRERDRGWRILLPLHETGHNIPNISFWSDQHGTAEKVAAVDIAGYTWLLDIWKVGSRPVRIDPPLNQLRNRGWGVMVLPSSSFLQTKSPAECVGPSQTACPTNLRADGGFYMSTTWTLAGVRDNASHEILEQQMAAHMAGRLSADLMPGPPTYVAGGEPAKDWIESSSDSESESDEDDSDDSDGSDSDHLSGQGWRWESIDVADASLNTSTHKAQAINLEQEATERFRQAMIICPSLGQTWGNLTLHALLRVLKEAPERKTKQKVFNLKLALEHKVIKPKAARNISILRTYQCDIELFSPDPQDTSVICRSLLEQHNQHAAVPFWDMALGLRMSMLLHVPELHAVLVGSMSGRVAVLRLTKRGARDVQPRRAFRVEWVLPRASDEDKRLRPYCCLLGIAVSPIPEAGAGKLGLLNKRRPGYPRRWRLLLHYMNHTMLQYTLEQKDPRSDTLSLAHF